MGNTFTGAEWENYKRHGSMHIHIPGIAERAPRVLEFVERMKRRKCAIEEGRREAKMVEDFKDATLSEFPTRDVIRTICRKGLAEVLVMDSDGGMMHFPCFVLETITRDMTIGSADEAILGGRSDESDEDDREAKETVAERIKEYLRGAVTSECLWNIWAVDVRPGSGGDKLEEALHQVGLQLVRIAFHAALFASDRLGIDTEVVSRYIPYRKPVTTVKGYLCNPALASEVQQPKQRSRAGGFAVPAAHDIFVNAALVNRIDGSTEYKVKMPEWAKRPFQRGDRIGMSAVDALFDAPDAEVEDKVTYKEHADLAHELERVVADCLMAEPRFVEAYTLRVKQAAQSSTDSATEHLRFASSPSPGAQPFEVTLGSILETPPGEAPQHPHADEVLWNKDNLVISLGQEEETHLTEVISVADSWGEEYLPLVAEHAQERASLPGVFSVASKRDRNFSENLALALKALGAKLTPEVLCASHTRLENQVPTARCGDGQLFSSTAIHRGPGNTHGSFPRYVLFFYITPVGCEPYDSDAGRQFSLTNLLASVPIGETTRLDTFLAQYRVHLSNLGEGVDRELKRGKPLCHDGNKTHIKHILECEMSTQERQLQATAASRSKQFRLAGTPADVFGMIPKCSDVAVDDKRCSAFATNWDFKTYDRRD